MTFDPQKEYVVEEIVSVKEGDTADYLFSSIREKIWIEKLSFVPINFRLAFKEWATFDGPNKTFKFRVVYTPLVEE